MHYNCTTTALQPCVAVKFTTVSTTCVCSGIPHGIGRICNGLVDPGSNILDPGSWIRDRRERNRINVIELKYHMQDAPRTTEHIDEQTSDGQTHGRTDKQLRALHGQLQAGPCPGPLGRAAHARAAMLRAAGFASRLRHQAGLTPHRWGRHARP